MRPIRKRRLPSLLLSLLAEWGAAAACVACLDCSRRSGRDAGVRSPCSWAHPPRDGTSGQNRRPNPPSRRSKAGAVPGWAEGQARTRTSKDKDKDKQGQGQAWQGQGQARTRTSMARTRTSKDKDRHYTWDALVHEKTMPVLFHVFMVMIMPVLFFFPVIFFFLFFTPRG